MVYKKRHVQEQIGLLAKHYKVILAFQDEYGDTIQQGLLIYPGKICYQLSEFVTALPFDALMKPRTISLDPIIEQRKKELEIQYSRL